jgi:hypothetical protein
MIYRILCIALINLLPQSSIAKDLEAALGVVAQSPTLERLRFLEEKERLEKLSEKAQWRQFPAIPRPLIKGTRRFGDDSVCSYRWPSWTFDHSANKWKTFRKCGSSIDVVGCYLEESDRSFCEHISVSCVTLKLSFEKRNSIGYTGLWSDPRFPANEGEREMLAALCDTIGRQEKK